MADSNPVPEQSPVPERSPLPQAVSLAPWEPLPVGTIVTQGVIMGVSGDLLLRGSEGPGLNLVILFAGLALSIRVVGHRATLGLSREARAWLLVGILFATGLVLRGAPELRILAFFAAAAAFALPAYRAGAAWLRSGGVSDQVEAVAGAMLHSGLAALRLVADAFSHRLAPLPDEDSGSSRLPAILRGLLLAAPFLFVFGALFMSADPVFSRVVTDFARLNLDEILPHVVTSGILAWLTCGYLTGFLTGTRVPGVREALPRPSIGITEAATHLALIDVLFASFVAVQFRYLFGGSGLVEVTPGLTYAEYAREGFAQLAVASALVLPSLLASDWLLRRERRSDDWIFRSLGGLQLLLLLVIIASALQRVRAYQVAYGLTQSRFYGAAFLGWLTLVSVVFATTVLRGRRERFAFPALASGFAFVALLFALNPDARIARANLMRAGAGTETPPVEQQANPTDREGPGGVDVEYLGSLSADAVPTLLEALPDLPVGARCTLAAELVRRWGPMPEVDWRSWNGSEARARRRVAAESPRLRSMAEGVGCP